MKYGIQAIPDAVLFSCGEKYVEVEKMNNYCCCNTRNSGTGRSGNDCENRSRRCYTIVLSIIGVLLAFVMGLIIGAALFAFVLIALPAFIAVAVILAVLFIVFLVVRTCSSDRSCGC